MTNFWVLGPLDGCRRRYLVFEEYLGGWDWDGLKDRQLGLKFAVEANFGVPEMSP
jgi:hypothetical protein